jgi:beta-ribofuranosylaminobenzene 5'-phosphate synthase
MTGPRLLVRTPGRLHFGLLGWGPESRRQFGGLGLMIESPGIELTVERATTQVVQGPLSDRVARILEIVRERIAAPGILARPVAIRILQAPPEHIGLGVGTQLSLAIASAVLQLAGYPDPSVEQLALLTGRGHRSGIGLHGFRRGGFLVDGGRREEGSVPPLLTRHHFPDEWSVLVVQPPGRHGLHGRDELRAFSELPPIAESLTDRLCRLVMLGILPAIVERDLAAFGAAIEELQAHVGASFAPAQGGPYSSPRAAEIVGELHKAGFTGCGQSSWGPTLYAFSDRPRDEVSRQAERLRGRLGLDDRAALVTHAADHGASFQTV